MSEFWFAVLATSVVTVLTLLVDWVVARFIIAARCIEAVKRSPTVTQVRKQLAEYEARKTATLAWGADLATVAMAMDLVGLSIWISKPDLFPFFSRFDSASVSMEIPVWFVLLALHAFLLVLSIIFKHLHSEAIGRLEPGSQAQFPHWNWARQRGWMLAGSASGVLALLSALIAFTNAV